MLLLVAAGVTDFARVFNTADMAASAASAGLQYGSMSPAHYGDLAGMQDAAVDDAGSDSGITAVASQFCTCSIGGAGVDCPATCTGSDTAETYIKVTTTIPFSPLFQFPLIPSVTNISGIAITSVQ
jgi:hypothetical protein